MGEYLHLATGDQERGRHRSRFNGTVTVTPTLKLSGLGYYRNFKQRRVDGNITDFEECNNGVNDFLCLDGDPTAVLLDGAGNPHQIPQYLNGSPAGSLDRTTTQTDSFGASAQAVEKSKLFGLGNQFLIGGSYDHGKVAYTAASELGTIGPQFVISPTGISLTAPADVAPLVASPRQQIIMVSTSPTRSTSLTGSRSPAAAATTSRRSICRTKPATSRS